MPPLRAIKFHAAAREGFSLLEVVVAMSVLLLLMIGLGSAFNYISRAWVLGSGDMAAHRGARSLADYIGMELRSAQVPVSLTGTVNQSNLQMLVDPPSSQVPPAYRYSDAIFFQAPFATETSYGDLAEIGYFVKWDQSNPAEPRPLLCRFFVNPSTQTSGTLTANPNYLIYDPNSPTSWLNQALLDSIAPATSPQGYTGLFAENVAGFWVRLYGLDGVELPKVFDSRTGYSYTYQYQYVDSTGTSQTKTTTQQGYLPARITVSLVQVDAPYASRLDPVWQQVQTLSTNAVDASDFMTQFAQAAATQPALRALLPGLQSYSTEVYLDNAR